MRILHFITSLRTGGAERLVTDLAPRLRDMGHHVEVLVIDGTRTHFTDRLEQHGIAVSHLSMGEKSMHNPLLCMRMRSFLRKNDFNIVHTHNTPCQAFAAAAAPRGTILVTTEHNTGNRRRDAIWGHLADKLLYRRYRTIISCGSETTRSLLYYMPALADKTVTIPNGIDLTAFADAEAAADIQQRFPGKKIICMVAAFRKQKDHATAIRALALLPADYVLVLAGTGDTLDECRAQAAQAGIEQRIFFAGIRPDVPSVFKAADVAVLSTHYEGFGLAAVEAMASGRPLVASDVDGMRGTVTPGGILFPDSDAEALASTIMALCRNASLRAATIEAGLRRAADFDIARTAEGYNAAYMALCTPNSSEKTMNSNNKPFINTH